MHEDIEPDDWSIDPSDRDRPGAMRAPERLYLPAADEASQLDEPPAWRGARVRADDIEYVRADLAAAGGKTTGETYGTMSAPSRAMRLGAGAAADPGAARASDPAIGADTSGTGDALVARWCAGWGDERPSRAVQRQMADDIDALIAGMVEARTTAVEARIKALEASLAALEVKAAGAGPARRTRAPRAAQAAEQLALELPPPGPASSMADAPAAPDGPADATVAEYDAPISGQTLAAQEPVAQESRTHKPDEGAPDPHAWTRADAYLARLWSSAHAESIAVLAGQPGGLAVVLTPEPTNEVDGEAVAIAVELPEDVAGGFEAAWAPATMRVIGYVARAEARKEALFAALCGPGAASFARRGARLHLEPDGWYVHIARTDGLSAAAGAAPRPDGSSRH